MILGAGETIQYVLVLHLREPGPFESSIELYLEENGIRKVELVVRGTTVGLLDVPNTDP